jgi:Zn-dependent alcohol dehydrogenase
MRTRAAIIREPVKPWEITEVELDELIRRYSLDEVNQGYQDLDDGKLIRGVIIHG